MDRTQLPYLQDDGDRNASMFADYDGITLDFSPQRATSKTIRLPFDLAKVLVLSDRISDFVPSARINTEDRAVLHTALRTRKDEVVILDGVNVVDQGHDLLCRIQEFLAKVLDGRHLFTTGTGIRNFVAIGIGGS